METTTHYYIKELLQKLKTLEEIAAQTSVSKNTIKNYIYNPTINARPINFNKILSAWVREVY